LGKDTIYLGVEVAKKNPKKFLTEPFRFYYFDLNLNTPDAAALIFFPFRLIPPGIRQRVSYFHKGITLWQSQKLFPRFTPPFFTFLLIALPVINLLRVFHGHDTFNKPCF
jgi:hypothetical protein